MKPHLVFLASAVFAATASATLIPLGAIPSTGNGIGAVNTSLTFQGQGQATTESGCVAFNGTTSVTGVCPAGFAGGSESNGASQTNVFTGAQLGFTATRNFSNLLLIFNGNEGGNAADQPITLSSLGLSLYSATGVLLQTFTTTAPYTALAFPGVGQAGFGFALDGPQAAAANLILAANPNLRVGTSANATNSNGGPETIQLVTVNAVPTQFDSSVPEPGTIGMLGCGLLLLAVRKRLALSA